MSGTNLIDSVREFTCRQAGSSAEAPPCSACSFIQETDKSPFVGGENIVFALQNHHGEAICMRIQKNVTEWSSYLLVNEVNIRKAIESNGITAFQRLIDFAPQGNTLINSPFMMLEWIHGCKLQWTDDFPVDLSKRNQIIYAIATVTMDLLKVQREGVSAKDYVEAKIKRKIERAQRGEYRGGSAEGCQRQFDMIERYWVPEFDDAPHVLVHGDLGPNNIIVDDECRFKSVIDLGWSEMVPLQFAAGYPRFLTYEPTDSSWQTNNTAMMERDRQFYLNCIKERASTKGGIEFNYYQLLSRDDQVNRYWWFKAIDQADIHQAMCAINWGLAERGPISK